MLYHTRPTDIDVQQRSTRSSAWSSGLCILGASNPRMAYRALEAEDKVSTTLSCNVLVNQRRDGTIEVSAVEPVASMQAINNPPLAYATRELQDCCERSSLKSARRARAIPLRR